MQPHQLQLQQEQQQQEQPVQAETAAPQHHSIKQDRSHQSVNELHSDSNAAQQRVQQQAPAWQNYSSVFTAAKAGMGGVDQQKIKQVVYEMSKNSAHFANEQRKQAQTDARIARLKTQAAQITPAQLAAFQKTCDAKISLLEAGRELDKVWLHVDMDAFYASVEERDQPGLKDKPMAVGGIGMICTANYLARTYGVRSAMPGFIAKKLCPQLVFVKPDFSKYSAASAEAFAVFRSYDERVAGASLDEAYLDVTQYCSTHGMTGEQVASELRGKVVEATRGLTCSVGVAPNMMLAKIASDKNKPNGQCVVGATREEVLEFIADLPIRKIPGIGKVMEQTLQALGVNTCSDLIKQAALLTALLSEISSSSLIHAGLGLGSTEHSSRGGGADSSEPGRKGISCERTFSAMSAAAEMEQMAEHLVSHLASDMASEAIEAKTLTLKLKTTAFEIRTRAATLPSYVSSTAAMLPPILKLLRAELPVEIRLMGVRGSNLRKAPQRLEQLAAEGKKLNALERLVLQGRQKEQQVQGHGQDGQQDYLDNQQQGQQQQGGQEQDGAQAQQQQQQDEGLGLGPGVGIHREQQAWQHRAGAEDQGDLQHDMHLEGPGMQGNDDGEVDPSQEGLLLRPSWCVPTQEELQAHYEQQCRQQEQQELDAADTVDACEGWEQQQPHEVSGSWQGAAAGLLQQSWDPQQQAQQSPHGMPPPPQQLQQQHQLQLCLQHQAQQQQQAGEDGDGPASKRRRRSFNHPAQVMQHAHVVAAVTATGAAEGLHSTEQQHAQQEQQQVPDQQQQRRRPLDVQEAAAAGGQQVHHQQAWQKALDLQQQHHTVNQLEHDIRQQHYQQQEQDLQQQHGHDVSGNEANDPGHHSFAEAGAATAAAAAAQPHSTKHDRGGASSSRKSAGGPWTCLACTFSGNDQKWLRCSVCETPKGDTQPPQTLLGPSGSNSSRVAAAAGRGSGRGGAAGGSSKQLTLEHLGLRKQRKR